MGAENSHVMVDEDTPPQTLEKRDLASVAKLIRDGRANRIVVMTGAGISTAAGIPDFRSPETGLYHNLERLNLPHAEAVFEIDYFRRNPDPFYVLAKELYPGKFHPTIAHVFIALLAKKSLLRMLFTQNIDCLERAAGVPGSRIIEAHGSFATQRCIDCKTPYPDKEMREHVSRGEPPRCITGDGGLVKPDIVFFGEQLPEAFHANHSVPSLADLILVMGTSLKVHPFASLPQLAMDGVPRVLFNMEAVGDLGSRADDVLVIGDCDSGVRKLADELGWRDDLEKMWRDIVGDKEAARQIAQINEPREKRKKDWTKIWTEDEVDELADAVEDRLELSGRTDGSEDANQGQVGYEGETQNSAEGETGSKEFESAGPAEGSRPTSTETNHAISSGGSASPELGGLGSTGKTDIPGEVSKGNAEEATGDFGTAEAEQSSTTLPPGQGAQKDGAIKKVAESKDL